MQSNAIQQGRSGAETLIFSAAFEGGNEKLIRVQSPKNACYLLRRNICIEDKQGREHWNESVKEFAGFAEYLREIKLKMTTYTPIEVNLDVVTDLKKALLAAMREMNQQTEITFFNLKGGFSPWMRWAKHFQTPNCNQLSENVKIYWFGKNSPITQINIDLKRVKSFQELLNYTYSSILINTYKAGRFGQDWTLYNLNKCQPCNDAARAAPMPQQFINSGDELAILRLNPARN